MRFTSHAQEPKPGTHSRFTFTAGHTLAVTIATLVIFGITAVGGTPHQVDAATRPPRALPTRTPAATKAPTRTPAASPTATKPATSTATAAPATATAVPATSPQARMLTLVNQARADAGLASVSLNAALNRAGQSYAETMASTGCFSHTCPPVTDFAQRDTQAGYQPWTNLGENIAAGYQTADDTFTAWMNSQGHRDNILNPRFRDMGLGVAYGGPYGIYWSQEFGAQS